MIWIDNDGCPRIVRELVFAAGKRKSLRITVVGNAYAQIPLHELFKMICVSGGFDAADDYIVENVQSGDLVITADVPLAARVVANGAIAISSHGRIFDSASIGEQLAVRNLLAELRPVENLGGGPPPFGPADKKKFADALDRTLAKYGSR